MVSELLKVFVRMDNLQVCSADVSDDLEEDFSRAHELVQRLLHDVLIWREILLYVLLADGLEKLCLKLLCVNAFKSR